MAQHDLIDTSHHHDDSGSKVIFGFWIYVMTDFILFAALFATYAVLHNNTYGGPGIAQIANLHAALIQTLILLTSTLTYGLAYVGMHNDKKSQVMFWLTITFLLGLLFTGLELHRFADLVNAGISWQGSGFLSAYFSLVGMHGMHLVVGLVWIIVLMIQLSMQGLTSVMRTRLTCLSLFWNFLSIVWIFIFTIVYLMGAL